MTTTTNTAGEMVTYRGSYELGIDRGECPAGELVVLEYMPEQHRSSHKAAGGSFGRYPHNGAVRRAVPAEIAAEIVASDGEWASVIDGLDPLRYID